MSEIKGKTRKRKGQQGDEPTTKVLLWHPDVHAFYNERLFYFFIQARAYTGSLLTRLSERLRARGITGACLYEIFGQYDLLLRVWLNPELEANVVEIVRELREEVSAAHPFRVTQVYHWALKRQSRIEDATHTSSLQLVSLRARKLNVGPDLIRSAQGGDTRVVNRLVREGAAMHWGPLINGDGVKFYISLQQLHPLTTTASEAVASSILELVRHRSGIRRPSLYIGEGTAWGLVKAIADNTYVVRDLVMTIRRAIVPFDMSTTTYIVSDREPSEKDDINESSLDRIQETEPRRWIAGWLPELYSAKLDDVERMNIELILTQRRKPISEGLGTEAGDVVRGLILGVISHQAPQSLAPLALFFARVEATLYQNWFNFLSQHGNGDANALSLEIRRACSSKDSKEISLGTLLCMHLKARERFGVPVVEIDWDRGPADFFTHVANIRNKVMHGALFDHISEEWVDVLDTILRFLPIYLQFAEAVELNTE